MPAHTLGPVRLTSALPAGLLAGAAVAAAGADPRFALAVAALAVLGPIATSRPVAGFLAGTLTGLRTPRPGEDRGARHSAMSGTEFEEHIANLARGAGLPVIMTPYSGDWGVDLIVGHRPRRVAVQCKRLSRPVGPDAVQQVVAGAPMQDCTRTMVVSNQGFTPAARRLAEEHGCTLVGGSELTRFRRILREVTLDPDDGDRCTG